MSHCQGLFLVRYVFCPLRFLVFFIEWTHIILTEYAGLLPFFEDVVLLLSVMFFLWYAARSVLHQLLVDHHVTGRLLRNHQFIIVITSPYHKRVLIRWLSFSNSFRYRGNADSLVHCVSAFSRLLSTSTFWKRNRNVVFNLFITFHVVNWRGYGSVLFQVPLIRIQTGNICWLAHQAIQSCQCL